MISKPLTRALHTQPTTALISIFVASNVHLQLGSTVIVTYHVTVISTRIELLNTPGTVAIIN